MDFSQNTQMYALNSRNPICVNLCINLCYL